LGSSTFRNLFFAFALLSARGAFAQTIDPPAEDSAAIPTGPQLVKGQVVRPGHDDMIPVPNVMVTLHRVGSDRAAPLDSTRADAKGQFQFHYLRSGDVNAIYFVSASYGGIAYFTPPLTKATVTGPDAEIAVFDTTSAPIPISSRGHHIVVSAVDTRGMRNITEVYELANDTSVTRISNNRAGGDVWSSTLPAGAQEFQVAQGDIPAQAVKFEDGKALVFAPIAPGLKQLAYNYELPAAKFPLRIPIVRDTQILEVLIEDEKGKVEGAKLQEKAPVAIEKRNFRRFLADDVPANAVTVIDLPADSRSRDIDPRYMIALTVVIGAAMVFALVRALRRA
jgi:hypothetical protein